MRKCVHLDSAGMCIPLYCTVAELKKFVDGIPEKTIHTWRGRIANFPARKIGGRVFIKLPAFLEMIENNGLPPVKKLQNSTEKGIYNRLCSGPKASDGGKTDAT